MAFIQADLLNCAAKAQMLQNPDCILLSIQDEVIVYSAPGFYRKIVFRHIQIDLMTEKGEGEHHRGNLERMSLKVNL